MHVNVVQCLALFCVDAEIGGHYETGSQGCRLLFHIAAWHNVDVNWPMGHSHRLYS